MSKSFANTLFHHSHTVIFTLSLFFNSFDLLDDGLGVLVYLWALIHSFILNRRVAQGFALMGRPYHPKSVPQKEETGARASLCRDCFH